MNSITFGKYEIRRELGRGAMGVVYEAHDPALGADVALKVLTVTGSATPEARRRQVERFCREARVLSTLAHPRVVRMFDQGEVGGRQFFSMELVRGTTLRDRLQFQGPLSVLELTRMAVELCEALEHVHQQGVIHRDIKPENLMILPDGSIKLMDFGIAQLVAEQSSAPLGGWQGSPAYMSPEQVAGRPVDGRSDLYSLAVTLYEAATGRRAVTGETIPAITHAITNEYPPPPAGLPPHLQGVLIRALAKDPAYRYARAGEMAMDIRTGRLTAAPFIPPPAPPAMSFAHAPPVLLGGDPQLPEPEIPALAAASAPTSYPPIPSGMQPQSPGAYSTPPAAARATCRMHPSMSEVAICSDCGHSMCYTCYLEIPGRGAVCRSCAFNPR